MITSTSNQQVRLLMTLVKKSKARHEQGVFVVEGRKMFEEAPVEWLKAVYAAESFPIEKLRDRLPAECSFEVLSDHVFKAVSDTQTPQGILCLVKIPEYRLEDIYRKEKTSILFLENIQDPGNLGTMIRTGEGAGVTGIVVSKNTVDLYNPKTIRSTMGSIYRVPVIIAEDFKGAIAQTKKQGVRLYAAHLKGQDAYDEPDYTKATGFLIGNEGNGLTAETADLADRYIRIPMEGKVESLNAAIAATLLMYEVNRQRRK